MLGHEVTSNGFRRRPPLALSRHNLRHERIDAIQHDSQLFSPLRERPPPSRPLSSPPSLCAHETLISACADNYREVTPDSPIVNSGFTTPDPPRTRVSCIPPSPDASIPPPQLDSSTCYPPLYFAENDPFNDMNTTPFLPNRDNDVPLPRSDRAATKIEPIGSRRRSSSSPLPHPHFPNPHTPRRRHPSYRVTLTHLPRNFSIDNLSSYFSNQSEAWADLPIRSGIDGNSTFATIEFPSKRDAELAVRSVTDLFQHATQSQRNQSPTSPAPSAVAPTGATGTLDLMTVKRRRSSSSSSLMSPRQQRSAIARTYDLLNGHSMGVRITELNQLFEDVYAESLPKGNALLKFLVQLDQLLLINRSDVEDVMIFITKVPAFRLVIDILRSKSESITITEFAHELETRLCVDLTNCDVLDFLKRWRVVQVYDDCQPVRVGLAPQGTCTVFLGGLGSSTGSDDILEELMKIDPMYSHVRIRINRSGEVANAFVDMPSVTDAEKVIGKLEGIAILGSNCIRAEIESSSAQKQDHDGEEERNGNDGRRRSKSKSPRSLQKNGNGRPRSNSGSAAQRRRGRRTSITDQLYQLLEMNGGHLLMSQIPNKFAETFDRTVDFSNPKLLVKMDRLLLLNCTESDDVMVFFTKLPAYRLVVEILKQHPNGISVENIRSCLETKMGMSTSGCDFEDFLGRWRFLTIRENRGDRTVHFTPHTGSTVFFGNLNIACTENDIYKDLSNVKSGWGNASVRLKKGKGFSYAFVDFDSREDALEAVACFDGKPAFRSSYVSADIETVEHKKSKNGVPAANGRATVYVGNLRDNVTKQEIQVALSQVDKSWQPCAVRLNLRGGWSHAFVDMPNTECADRLIDTWNRKTHSIGCAPLRVEISKKKM